jgi:hypothetical protein
MPDLTVVGTRGDMFRMVGVEVGMGGLEIIGA